MVKEGNDIGRETKDEEVYKVGFGFEKEWGWKWKD